MADLDRARRELDEVPPRAFAKARTALAARLVEAGNAAAAREVKQLRAVPMPVWVVNRLASVEPGLVRRLLVAASALRTAQLGRGRGKGGIARAAAERGETVRRLLASAEPIVRQAGVTPSHALRARVETTLTAAAAGPAHRDALRHGRLEHELAAQGFDVFAGARPSRRAGRRSENKPSAPAESAGPSRAEQRAAARDGQRARAAARREARSRVAAARAALRAERARDAARLEHEADEAARQLDQAQASATAAAAALREARRRHHRTARALAAARRRAR